MPVQLVPILKDCVGINNKTDPARLQQGELQTGVNVDIDDSMRVGRRKGFTATSITDSVHSLWSGDGRCFYVTGTSMYELGPNYTSDLVRSDLETGLRVRYVSVNNDVYYCNGIQSGRYTNGVDSAWARPSAHPSPPGYDDDDEYMDPPVGHLVAYHNGRIWIADNNYIWMTMPFAYFWVRPRDGYLAFNNRIRAIMPVDDGVYVSTSSEIVFLGGASLKEVVQRTVAKYPAVEGTEVEVDASKIGSGEMNGQGWIFTTSEGVCLGLGGGQMINLTQQKLALPSSSRGTGLVLNGKYVALLEA